jgi:hypothetical protein
MRSARLLAKAQLIGDEQMICMLDRLRIALPAPRMADGRAARLQDPASARDDIKLGDCVPARLEYLAGTQGEFARETVRIRHWQALAQLVGVLQGA